MKQHVQYTNALKSSHKLTSQTLGLQERAISRPLQVDKGGERKQSDKFNYYVNSIYPFNGLRIAMKFFCSSQVPSLTAKGYQILSLYILADIFFTSTISTESAQFDR